MAHFTTSTPEKRTEFLDALAESGNVSASAQLTGLSRRSLYDWRDAAPDFRREWDHALQIGLDGLQDEAVRRAREGVDVGVYQQGLRIGTARKYSDLLLMFLLNNHLPRDQDRAEASEITEIAPGFAPGVGMERQTLITASPPEFPNTSRWIPARPRKL